METDLKTGISQFQAKECRGQLAPARHQERSIDQILPQPPEEANPAHSLSLNFWSPDLCGDKLLLF